MSEPWRTDLTPQSVHSHECRTSRSSHSARKIWWRAAIAILTLIGVGCTVLKPLTLMLQAKVYADRVMTTSFAAWDAAAMVNELELTAIEEENGDVRQRFEAWSRRLGPLRSHRVTGTHANMNFGRPTTSRVTIEADFELAPATIGLELIQAGRAWRITNWTIHSHIADPLASLGVIWSDTFDDPTSDGCTDAYTGPEGVSECSGGELRLTRINMRPHSYILRRLGSRYTDAKLEIDARLAGRVEERGIGIGCRDQGSRREANYQLIVAPAAGLAALHRMQDGGGPNAVNVTGWIPSAAIRPGTTWNRLELSCIGQRITASVNGSELFSIEDPAYERGFFFAYAEVGDAAVPLEARFDNAVIKEAP